MLSSQLQSSRDDCERLVTLADMSQTIADLVALKVVYIFEGHWISTKCLGQLNYTFPLTLIYIYWLLMHDMLRMHLRTCALGSNRELGLIESVDVV